MTTRAFVSLSGGIDSTTCLAIAVHAHGRENVETFSFDYGQRHIKELECATAICAYYGVKNTVLQLGPQPRSNLTDPEGNIPKTSYAELGEGISPSYHHYRNGQFLSVMATHAVAALEKTDSGILYIGVHAEDAENWAYADCTPEFIGAQVNAIFIGTYQKIRLKAPLLEMSKTDVVRKGTELGAPLELSWSCYLGGEKHCGECPTCRARKEAFAAAGLKDPTEYAA